MYAIFVKSFSTNQGPDQHPQYYIATQAPTQVTVEDFWTMVWQQGCQVTVCLTQLMEGGQVSDMEGGYVSLVSYSSLKSRDSISVHVCHIIAKLSLFECEL